jgi:uncharacterized Zn-binding protein involved in type VI secretion
MVTGIVPHVGGPISKGEPTVMIGFMPAARQTDLCVCVGPPDMIAMGSLTVKIGFLPAARMGDLTAHGGSIVMGFPTVMIGDVGMGSPTSTSPGAPGAPAGAGSPAPSGGSGDPCGKDAISNVTKCCGSEIFDEAKKANGGKDPKIVFGTPSSGFDAETDTSTGTITVSNKSDKCTATESVYFELANLAAKPKFDQIDADAAAGNLSREEYTRANERVEYENVQKTLAAIDKCKDKWGCGSHNFGFEAFRPAKDFDDYYDNYLSEDHKNHYRNHWDNAFKSAYEAKHPPTP